MTEQRGTYAYDPKNPSLMMEDMFKESLDVAFDNNLANLRARYDATPKHLKPAKFDPFDFVTNPHYAYHSNMLQFDSYHKHARYQWMNYEFSLKSTSGYGFLSLNHLMYLVTNNVVWGLFKQEKPDSSTAYMRAMRIVGHKMNILFNNITKPEGKQNFQAELLINALGPLRKNNFKHIWMKAYELIRDNYYSKVIEPYGDNKDVLVENHNTRDAYKISFWSTGGIVGNGNGDIKNKKIPGVYNFSSKRNCGVLALLYLDLENKIKFQKSRNPEYTFREEIKQYTEKYGRFYSPYDLEHYPGTYIVFNEKKHVIIYKKGINKIYHLLLTDSNHYLPITDVNRFLDAPKGKKWCDLCQQVSDHKQCPKLRNMNNDFIPKPDDNYLTPYDKVVIMQNSSIKCKNIRYFAYDIESFLDKQEDGRTKHNFAMVCVQELYQDEQYIFDNLEEFFNFLTNAKKPPDNAKNKDDSYKVVAFAHNATKYDNVLLIEWLIKNELQPGKMISDGRKVISFTYNGVQFSDSCKHIAQSLDEAASAFQVPISKGKFPYIKFTTKNRHYNGDYPLFEEYDTRKMKGYELWDFRTKVRLKFINYYVNGRKYNLWDKCVKYCRNDVRMLARTLEKYRDMCISLEKIDPLQHLTVGSYVYKVYRSNYMPESSVYIMNERYEEVAREALFGGRTEPFKLLYKCPYTEEKNEKGEIKRNYTKFIRYFDINSLYPTVMMMDELPIGLPTVLSSRDEEIACLNDKGYEAINEYLMKQDGFYFVYCDVAENNLNIPILPRRWNHRLVFDKAARKGVYTSVELKEAIKHGYRITSIDTIYKFKASKTLFNAFIHTYYNLKKQAKIDGNKALEAITKLMLNNLWGKLSQRRERVTKKILKYPAEYKKLLNADKAKKINITGKPAEITKKIAIMTYERADNGTLCNPFIGAAITANARIRLFRALHAVGDAKILYGDTDSIIFITDSHDLSEIGIPIGLELGEWKDELKGDYITEFVSLGPKTYAFRTASGEEKSVTKGFITEVGFEVMENIVLGQQKTAQVDDFRFVRNNQYEIHTKEAKKVIQLTLNKRMRNGFETTSM